LPFPVIPVDLWPCSNCLVSVFPFFLPAKLTLLQEEASPDYPIKLVAARSKAKQGRWLLAGWVNISSQAVMDTTSARGNHDHCMASSSITVAFTQRPPSRWCKSPACHR